MSKIFISLLRIIKCKILILIDLKIVHANTYLIFSKMRSCKTTPSPAKISHVKGNFIKFV